MPARPQRTLTCLGVGDGHVAADRGHAAFLYEFGATRLLVDCGEPASQALLRAGTRLETLDRVFISHLHFDHVGGLFTLLQGLWLSRWQHPLTIHLPEPGLRPVQNLMRAARLFDAPPPFDLQWEPLRAWQPVPAGAGSVTPVPSSHLRALAVNPRAARGLDDEAFSFLLEDRDCRVAHTADLGGLNDVPPLIREPLDLFVCELAHLEPADLFARLRGHPIRRAVFVHLSADQWQERRRWRARAARALSPVPVRIPADGERIAF